jgi:plasmid replication initiation protein
MKEVVYLESSMINKPTGSIHISNELNVIERKTWNILIKMAYRNLLIKDEKTTHILPTSEIFNMLGWDSDNNHEDLKVVCKKLVETSVQWNIFNKDKKNAWGITGFLSYAEVKDGICSYRFDESIIDMLFRPTIYAKLDMNIQKKIKNKHALALWEFFVDELCTQKTRSIGRYRLTIVNIVHLLGLKSNDYYKEFRRLNQKILKPAIEEINELTDINVKFEPIKMGRAVDSIEFSFGFKNKLDKNIDAEERINQLFALANVIAEKIDKESKQSSGMLELNPICKVSDSVREKMGKYGFSDKEIMGLVEKSGSDNIEESIDAAIQYITGSSSEIKTPKAVIKKAIKDSWGMDNGKEKIIAEQAEKIEKDREERIKEFLQKANEYQIFIVNYSTDKNKGYSIAFFSQFTLKDYSDEDGENFLLDIQTNPHDDWRDLEKIIIDNKDSFGKEFPAINTVRINGARSMIKFKETE